LTLKPTTNGLKRINSISTIPYIPINIKLPVYTMKIILMQWHCNGIKAHISELKQFLGTTLEKLHVICIQETKLKIQHRVDITGYNIKRKDRTGKGGGGVLTLIDSSMSYSVIKTPEEIEAISVRITTKKECHHHKYISPPCYTRK